jgi:hypothetical protein
VKIKVSALSNSHHCISRIARIDASHSLTYSGSLPPLPPPFSLFLATFSYTHPFPVFASKRLYIAVCSFFKVLARISIGRKCFARKQATMIPGCIPRFCGQLPQLTHSVACDDICVSQVSPVIVTLYPYRPIVRA